MSSVLARVDLRTQLAGHNRLEVLMFRLRGAQRFGINVFKVQEVIKTPALTRLPHTHRYVRGVAHLRGRTISVLDLAMAIGLPPLAEGEDSYVIVTEFNRSVQGFVVSAVDRIVNLTWDQIRPPPRDAGDGHYLTAVTQVDGELVEIIDVEKVLAEVLGISDAVDPELVAHAGVGGSGERPFVLVAEDSMVARNQIRRTLAQIGVEAVAVGDGKAALDLLQQWSEQDPERLARLSMVISDIEMPVMDGYALTTRLRADPRLQHLYVLLHTSLSGVFNEAMVERVGANRFIPKFTPDVLAEAVLAQVRGED